MLGLCIIAAFNELCNSLKKLFGARWLQWFIAITVTQSHFMFYLTRPLPNIFALPLGEILIRLKLKENSIEHSLFLVLIALSNWLKNDNKQFILFSGAAIIIFRTELALFLGLLLLHDIYYKRISFQRFIINNSCISFLI